MKTGGATGPIPPPPLFIRDLQRFAQPEDRRECLLTAYNYDFGWNERISLDVLRHRREKGRGRRSLRALLFVKLVEQGLGIFQVVGVEAFCEPVVDLGEHRARFVAMTLLREQSREAGRGAQFK